MLTHTIRALSLVGLIVIAHSIKPFSLGNVTAFAHHSLQSFSFVLPEAAVTGLERTGELLALLGTGWGEDDTLAGRLADKLVALRADFSSAENNASALPKTAAANKRAGTTSKPARRFAKTLRGLQAHKRSGFGAAPLPIIPGIEASLMPSATLMALPLFHAAPGEAGQDAPGGFSYQPKLLNSDCDWRSSFEKQTWIPEEALLKLQELQLPQLNLKVRGLNPRANTGQACAQPGKASGARAGNGKQSC